MKLVFTKNEKLEILVHKLSGGTKTKFNYVDMIKDLIKDKKLDEPELIGEFTEAEKESINSMVYHINTEVDNFYSDEDEQEE